VRTRGIVKRRSRPAAKRARSAAKLARPSVKAARPAAKVARRATRPARPDIHDEIAARRKALADLMHSKVLGQGDVSRGFNQITETAVQVLDVERASVWRLIDSGAGIECMDLYERSQNRHSSGVRILAADVPRYFEALQRERAIRAHNARTDPRTSEFRKGYLEPLGITSMLDAPVFLRGKMVGVVCHEHTGRTRRWKQHEELLASSFADFVALVLETAAWHEAEDALRVERDALESKVAERTRDLQDSEANLRALVDFWWAPFTDTRDGRKAAVMLPTVKGTIETWVANMDRPGLQREGAPSREDANRARRHRARVVRRRCAAGDGCDDSHSRPGEQP